MEYFCPGGCRSRSLFRSGLWLLTLMAWGLLASRAPATLIDLPNVPNLIYSTASGEVTLDASEAIGGVVTAYTLRSGGGFLEENFTPFLGGLVTELDTELGELFFDGASGQHSIGQVFPTGMDYDALDLFLTDRSVVGSLGTGASLFDLIVIDGTTTPVPIGAASGGQTGGGSSSTGGVDFVFEEVTGGGTFETSYDTSNLDDLVDVLPEEASTSVSFGLPGDSLQVWNLDFDGSFSGTALVTFGYDESLLSVPEAELGIYHFDDGVWEYVTTGFLLDTVANTITVEVEGFSPFILGTQTSPGVPEPATWLLAALGFLGLMPFVRRAAKA